MGVPPVRFRPLVVSAGVAALSGWVAIAGVVWNITPRTAAMCLGENYRFEPMCWYAAEYSTLLAPWWDHGTIGRRSVLFIVVMATSLGAVVAMAAFRWAQASGRHRPE